MVKNRINVSQDTFGSANSSIAKIEIVHVMGIHVALCVTEETGVSINIHTRTYPHHGEPVICYFDEFPVLSLNSILNKLVSF